MNSSMVAKNSAWAGLPQRHIASNADASFVHDLAVHAGKGFTYE